MIPAPHASPHPEFWSPEWLVSVRNLSEAALVSNFDVDILDLKEPNDGALAPVSLSTLNEIAAWAARCNDQRRSGTAIRLSAALGESEQACQFASSVPAQFSFAKSGPSELDSQSKLQEHWRRIQSLLPQSVELVAVAYADYQRARTLPPEKVLDSAVDFGLSRILIDTLSKEFGSTDALLGATRLAEFGEQAHRANSWWSLAGSISLETFARMREQPLSSMPDCIAVRGAICNGNRKEAVCPVRLQKWSRARTKGPLRTVDERKMPAHFE